MKYFMMLLSIASIFAGGCVSVRYTPLGYQQYHPIDSASVQVFMSAADVPGKFEKIGLLTASAQANTNDKSVINAMIDKAGENGADGIILGQFNNPDALTQVAGSLLHFTTLMKAQAVAIRFLDAIGFTAKTAPAAPPALGTVPVFTSADGTLRVKIYNGGEAYLLNTTPGESYHKPVFLSDYAQSAQFLPGPSGTRVLLTLASGSTLMFDSNGTPLNGAGN